MSDIILDPDVVAVTAADWGAYAEALEQHGQLQHVPLAELPALLGDVYADYTEAKAAEYEARTAAYQRVAAQARAHAEKLGNTRQQFIAADDDSAQRITAVALDTSGNTVPGEQPVPYSTHPVPGLVTQSVPAPADSEARAV